MTPQPERHALADVLASLSECPLNSVRYALATIDNESLRIVIERESDRSERLCVRRHYADGSRGRLFPLTHADPAEAFERLTTDGVLPMSWAGDTSRAFWCPLCKGKRVAYSALRVGPKPGDTVLASPDPVPCFCCDEVPSIADLVAWASLGVETIQRAEHLARETTVQLAAYGLTTGQRCVVWKVAKDRRETITLPDEVWQHRTWFVPELLSRCPPARALWDMGLALDAITDDALVVVVPSLGDVT